MGAVLGNPDLAESQEIRPTIAITTQASLSRRGGAQSWQLAKASLEEPLLLPKQPCSTPAAAASRASGHRAASGRQDGELRGREGGPARGEPWRADNGQGGGGISGEGRSLPCPGPSFALREGAEDGEARAAVGQLRGTERPPPLLRPNLDPPSPSSPSPWRRRRRRRSRAAECKRPCGAYNARPSVARDSCSTSSSPGECAPSPGQPPPLPTGEGGSCRCRQRPTARSFPFFGHFGTAPRFARS